MSKIKYTTAIEACKRLSKVFINFDGALREAEISFNRINIEMLKYKRRQRRYNKLFNNKRMENIMKTLMCVIIVMFITITCKSQVSSNYEGNWEFVTDAENYLGFWEELTDTNTSQLADSIDWNAQGLTVSFITTDITYIKEFVNDGRYLRLGIVARNTSGTYGMMRVSGFYKKGTIPGMTGSVGIIKQ